MLKTLPLLSFTKQNQKHLCHPLIALAHSPCCFVMAWWWSKWPKLGATKLNNRHCCVWLKTCTFNIVFQSMLCFAPWQVSHWNINMYLVAFNNYFIFAIIKNMSRFISSNLCWKKATFSLATNPHFLACPLMVLYTMSEWIVNLSWHPFCGLNLIVSFISISWPFDLR